MSGRATRRAGFGPLISGSAAVTAIPIPYFTDGINGEANGLFGAIFANGNGS